MVVKKNTSPDTLIYTKNLINLSFLITPDELQAKQIVIDAYTSIHLSKKNQYSDPIDLHKLLKQVILLAIKREKQLQLSDKMLLIEDLNQELKYFFSLPVQTRVVFALNFCFNFSLESIQLYTELTQIQIKADLIQLNDYFRYKEAVVSGYLNKMFSSEDYESTHCEVLEMLRSIKKHQTSFKNKNLKSICRKIIFNRSTAIVVALAIGLGHILDALIKS